MHWETQNGEKSGLFSFWEQGFFQSIADFETEDFSYKMEVSENIIGENKQQVTREKSLRWLVFAHLKIDLQI